MTRFLSEDLVFAEILTKLPAKSLMRFKCVSKNWMTGISGDHSFINAHRRQQISEESNPCAIILYNKYASEREIEEDEEAVGPLAATLLSGHLSKVSEDDMSYLVPENGLIEAAGSCEGLVCLTSFKFPEQVVLWNPATRQHRQLPCPSDVTSLFNVSIGLDEVSGNWKVVYLCLGGSSRDSMPVSALVFAKSDTVWRDCEASGIKGFLSLVECPVAAAGALHWDFSPSGTSQRGILSFDLNSEVFQVRNPPDCRYFTICNWRSSLAVFTYEVGNNRHKVPGYLMVASPSSCGSGLSWSKIVKITFWEFELSRIVWKEQFLVTHFGEGNAVSLVDPEAQGEEIKNLKHFRIDFEFSGDFKLYDYVPTIVPVY